jgi:opacity protein-like surface antigen
MNRISFVAAALGLIAIAAVPPLPGQSLAGTPVQFGVMGGAAKPVGDVAFVTHLDWSLGALVSIGAPQSHLSLRVDGQWQQLAGNQPITGGNLACLGCQTNTEPRAQSYRVLDLTTNAVYNFAPTASRSFYLIGGVGAYNERQYDPASEESASVTRFGFNGGAGVRFRVFKLQPFVEARYHNIVGAHSFASGQLQYNRSQTFQFVPINVGFVF